MGSKSVLLQGELGDILRSEAADARRFVDLFAGSGAVASFIAESVDVPVLSVDLQEYSRVLSASVIERTAPVDAAKLVTPWIGVAQEAMQLDVAWIDEIESVNSTLTADEVVAARNAAGAGSCGFIMRHYGGHYFSPRQARVFDALHENLPEGGIARTVLLSALIRAASRCAAAPGHTAQPFQPNRRLLPYIEAAWKRDVITVIESEVANLSSRYALAEGEARRANAAEVVSELGEGDLVFCDPPYSAAQYSRFYHVLEGIAIGGWPSVSGKGRAPSRAQRATSSFSLKSQASVAMSELLEILRERECRVVITFPDAEASNGMSANSIVAEATKSWSVAVEYVDSLHSTLGGSSLSEGRGGRRRLKEAVLTLSPR
nr:DNA adenine methylase [Cellulosimicrobium sp. MM]